MLKFFESIFAKRRWREINRELAQVEEAHQRWLTTMGQPNSGMPWSAICSARAGGDLARRTLDSLPQQGHPGVWLHQAVRRIEQATEHFRHSGENDEDNFGLASVGRAGVVLKELHQTLYSYPIEAHDTAPELYASLLAAIAQQGRQYRYELMYLDRNDPLHAECAGFEVLCGNRSLPEPRDGETAVAWSRRFRAWLSEQSTRDGAQGAACARLQALSEELLKWANDRR